MLSVTQNAQAASSAWQTRTFTFDGLGRMTQENVPESGVTSYFYDTSGNCPGFAGDLVMRFDAIGSVTCYAYDKLHRLTDITYPSGPNIAVTSEKHFVYDSGTFSFGTPTNIAGRLAEAYTGPSTAKITDLGYSYSLRGEVTDTYQSTPHSGGYYHIAESYWADGSTFSVSTNFAGMPTWNYTPDGEGRLNSIKASSGQNPLLSTTYGVFGPTNLTYGSSDTDTYGYDPQTGRQNSYAFNINGQSETGSLTWNANGTLRTLQISDPFQAPNAQTCTNTYDDLTRLTNNSCSGTGALSNTFAYDLFGNMTKSGSSNFLPTYNLHNQYQTLPSDTPTYSASGNPTYDGSHRYVWDSDNKNVQLDSGALIMTYDALGRWVERNNTAQSQIYQAVYAPDGREAAVMNGQSIISVYVDLPKGAKAIYLSNGINNYWHPDWLGTARLMTSTTRTKVFDQDFGPFGELRHGLIADNFFTGVAQVPEANDLRTFPARNLGTGQSRWLSPDPAGMAAVDITNPQTFNRYAYVLGNPLGLVDPSGLTSGSPCENNLACMGQIPGCVQNPQTCAQKYFTANPFQGVDPFQLIGIPVTETTWVPDGSMSPRNTASYWFSPGASATVNYFPQAGGWQTSTIGNAFTALADGDPLGGSYSAALGLVGQNVNAQYAFLGKFAAGAAAAGTGVAALSSVSGLTSTSGLVSLNISRWSEAAALSTVGSYLFAQGNNTTIANGIFNANDYFRIGVGFNQGQVFRLAVGSKTVPLPSWIPGVVRGTFHFDLWRY